MTPNDIEFLIHCHVSPRVHERIESNAIQETIERFLASALIIQRGPGDKIYYTTDKGAAHLRQLCNLSLPKQVFVDYEGKEIKG